MSVDPMSDKYPGISPYVYCSWNPILFIDSSGLEKIVSFKNTPQNNRISNAAALFPDNDPVIHLWAHGLPNEIETYSQNGNIQEILSWNDMKNFLSERSCLYKNKTEEDCKTNIERWIYNLILMNSTTKPLAFQDIMPVFKEVASAAELASMSEEEYRRYMNSLDNYRTAVACYDYAYEEGEAKGRVEERAKATRDHAIAFKKAGASIEMIATALNMSIEEVEALLAE